MFKKFLVFFAIYIVHLPFSFADPAIQLRGAQTEKKNFKEETIKLSDDFLKPEIYEELSLRLNQIDNIVASDLIKNNKIPSELSLRGNAKSIYKDYVDSVFLVVNIKDNKPKSIGAGSVIDKSGLIITNYHVVKDAQEIDIVRKPARGSDLKDAKYYRGSVLLMNQSKDLAVLKVHGLESNVKVIPLGNLSDISVGEEVHAIGHPKNFFWSYTKGVVSQIRPNYKWRTTKSGEHQADVIQTQTPISPGNSGGPLFSDSGKLVGINTMKASGGENLNFAVSVEHAKAIIKKENLAKVSTGSSLKNPTKYVLKKYPNAIPSDHNKNGVIDTWYIDTNNNGKVDLAYVDDNENGKIEAILIDKNENGIWEKILIDKNEDGKIDYALIDKDENGKPDHIAYFNNGKFDRVEKFNVKN